MRVAIHQGVHQIVGEPFVGVEQAVAPGRRAGFQRVHMYVVQARQYQATFQVFDHRGSPDVGLHPRIGADVDDQLATNGEGFGIRLIVIGSVDLAVDEGPVGDLGIQPAGRREKE